MTKKSQNKVLLIVLIIFFISGCSIKQDSKEVNPSLSRIFDHSGNLIAELNDNESIPEKYYDYITQALAQVTSKTRLDPYAGLDIYTNIDTTLQDALSSSVDSNYDSAVIVTDNKTGKIIALYNSTYKDERKGTKAESKEVSMLDNPFSVVALLSPLFSYPLAFEYLSTSTADYVLDSPFKYVGTDLTAKNSDGNHFGAIPLQQSFNETRVSNLWLADAVIDSVGIDKVKTYLSSFSTEENFIESTNVQYAMNGTSLSIMTIANGYQMILNGGEHIEASYINKIINRTTDSEISLSFSKTKSISEETSFLTTELLKNSFSGLTFFDVLESQNRQYQLYGYAGDYEINTSSNIKSHLFSSIIANTDYSISTFTKYQFNDNTNLVESSIQKLHASLLNELEETKVLGQSVPKPLGIIETNYLPGTLNDLGIDAHTDNTTNTPNIGKSK